MTNDAFKEKRETKRIRCRISFKHERFDTRTKTPLIKEAVAKNLSSQGLFFETDEMLPLGSKIKMRLVVPYLDKEINVDARIVRIEEIEAGTKFGVGVLFVEIADDDRYDIIQRIEQMDITKLLDAARQNGASDLHLTCEYPPTIRVNGKLVLFDMEKLNAENLKRILYAIMTDDQIARFEKEKELDFGFSSTPQNRFRVNIHQQRGNVEATFRAITSRVPSIIDLGLPPIVETLARIKEGIIVVAGPTGSGKTTTLASMINLINHERKSVIICLERPIEYLHENIKSIIKQREVGIDTHSFSAALKSSMRQDPNVIMVGEMEDPETVKTAILAAETGYLVLTSLHAPNTIQALDRLVSTFPIEYKKHVLSQLSRCIKGIVTQLLLPRKDGKGRVVAAEVAIVNDAVRRVIRDDDMLQLTNIIQTGSLYKMQSMHDSILRLYQTNIIDKETAETFSTEFQKATYA